MSIQHAQAASVIRARSWQERRKLYVCMAALQDRVHFARSTRGKVAAVVMRTSSGVQLAFQFLLHITM